MTSYAITVSLTFDVERKSIDVVTNEHDLTRCCRMLPHPFTMASFLPEGKPLYINVHLFMLRHAQWE